MRTKIIALILGIAVVLTLCACQSLAKAPSQNTKNAAAGQTVSGGWEINQGRLDPAANREAAAAFKKATATNDGYEYELIAVLGSQVVAGTNYSYFCRGKAVYPNAKPEYLIVNVYENLEGKARITATKDIPVAVQNESESD